MGSLRAVAFSPDGRLLAAGGMDAMIHLWDVTSGVLAGEPLMAHDGPVMSLAFHPDGDWLVSGSRDSTLIVWDVTARQVVFVSPAQRGWITALAFNPAGSILASGGEWGGVTLWDGKHWRALGLPLAVQSDTVWSLAFSPDGRTLAAGSHDTTITLWTVDAESWTTAPCRIANRNLTPAEWARYFPSESYRQTCPDLDALP
jgi:WD40 repeat protein